MHDRQEFQAEWKGFRIAGAGGRIVMVLALGVFAVIIFGGALLVVEARGLLLFGWTVFASLLFVPFTAYAIKRELDRADRETELLAERQKS